MVAGYENLQWIYPGGLSIVTKRNKTWQCNNFDLFAIFQLFKMLFLDNLFDDVKRMDKRQFLYQVRNKNRQILVNDFVWWWFCLQLGLELRNDSVFCFDDLEGPDGSDGIRVPDSCCSQWFHGASFPQRRSVIPHKLWTWRYTSGWNSCF